MPRAILLLPNVSATTLAETQAHAHVRTSKKKHPCRQMDPEECMKLQNQLRAQCGLAPMTEKQLAETQEWREILENLPPEKRDELVQQSKQCPYIHIKKKR